MVALPLPVKGLIASGPSPCLNVHSMLAQYLLGKAFFFLFP